MDAVVFSVLWNYSWMNIVAAIKEDYYLVVSIATRNSFFPIVPGKKLLWRIPVI